jgi:GT2 family glycosyltransferase
MLNEQTSRDLISEIIIVDSSNSSKFEKLLLQFKSENIKVIRMGAETIPAISRNFGAKEAKGEILAFIDSDAYPAPDWLEHIAKACENNRRVGGGAIEIPDFQKDNSIALAQYYLQFNEYIYIGDDRPKSFVPSCNIFCDRELFKSVGGFADLRAAEDVLFGLKVSKIAKLWFLPQIRVYHIFRQDLKEFLKNQILLGKYIIIYRRMYYDKLIYKGVIPIVLFPIFLYIKLIGIIIRIYRGGALP